MVFTAVPRWIQRDHRMPQPKRCESPGRSEGGTGEEPRPPRTHSVTNNPYTLIDAIWFSKYVKPFVHYYYIIHTLHYYIMHYYTHDMCRKLAP